MKKCIGHIVFSICLMASIGIALIQKAYPATEKVVTSWPLQLSMRVPFEPTAFSSAEQTHLVYELYLTNMTGAPIELHRIEVVDADTAASAPIAAFEAGQLDAVLQPSCPQSADRKSDSLQILPGCTSVTYVWIAIDQKSRLPDRLAHRVLTADVSTLGAIIGTHSTKLLVLGAPLMGANWFASDGPSNDADNHHRRGILVFDGRPLISRRYAIDWMQVKEAQTFSGDAADKRSYFAYGKPVVAVADSIVVMARDGLPDNVPGHNDGFRPAVAITPNTVAGNTIVLDLGGGQFAHYLHLQPGSVRVKTGDHVRHGQILARIGDSGDAREPHLHFQVSTSSNLLAGDGVPYLIDRYQATASEGTKKTLAHEMPLGGMTVDFVSPAGNR